MAAIRRAFIWPGIPPARILLRYWQPTPLTWEPMGWIVTKWSKTLPVCPGPYDFTPTDPDLVKLFGPPARYPLMQATTYVDGKQPPMLLLWGDKDQYVGRINLDKLAAAVHRRGGCVETKIYPDVDHIKIVSAFSWVGGPPVANDVAAFFRRDDAGQVCPRSASNAAQ